MFTPIKNFITYIQRNASSNSIFGGNSTSEDSPKMEAETFKTENSIKDDKGPFLVEEEEKEEEKKMSGRHKNSSLKLRESQTKSTVFTTRKLTATTTNNSYDFEVGDIEAQIQSSMLKKPVKSKAVNADRILRVKESTNIGCRIFISHDYNRNQALTPIDDELEDFRHDPTAILGNSSPSFAHYADDVCSIGSSEENLVRHDINVKRKRKPKDVTDQEETETEVDTEVEAEQKDVIDVEDSEDETFLDMDNFKNNNIIVIEEVDLNVSTTSTDTVNTADDPLAIAGEEQEAFAADKAAALEELNLFNNSHTSHDEDTTTTTEDDLQWLKTDLEDPQPSCSKVIFKENSSKMASEKEERNGEGSDSGLGSETSALHTTITSITDTSQLNTTTRLSQTKRENSAKSLGSNVSKSPPKYPSKPYKSNLKRHIEVDDDVNGLENVTSTGSSLNYHSSLNGGIQKKPKRSINFDTVQVYYFPRQQGFSCVPSAGGCTLGMGPRHVSFKTLSIAEHAAELRRAHRMQLQEINPRGSSSDDSEESEEDYLSEGSGSDLDGESNGFLQPVSPKQRRTLLKAAGIRKIDPSEKAECRNIRNSREVCGCSCRSFCDPETCACSQSGIKCQVDRDMFPCGCSRDACGNTIGRVEFNPARVRTHFIHTLMRLEMENRQQQNPYTSAVASPLHMQPTPVSFYQSHLQPQSNYSSGYASPAYNTASELHQQTAASSYYHTQTPSTANGLYVSQPSSEIAHSSGTTTTGSQYSIDSLDTSLFSGTTTATPSYEELLPVASYHYGNLQTQTSPYNSYHTPYINSNNTTTSLNTSNTYSSCAVPSVPPFGTATTTEAAGVYHSVNSLSALEITTAPSCNIDDAASLENDAGTNFISLSTPLASSSRLSQINDLLQHNRNAPTALVAVSQTIDEATSTSISSRTSYINGSNYNTAPSSPSTYALPVEDSHKINMTYEEFSTPLRSSPVMRNVENDQLLKVPTKRTTSLIPTKMDVPPERLEESSINTELLPQKLLCKDGTKTTMTVNTTIEPSTIEVAAGK